MNATVEIGNAKTRSRLSVLWVIALGGMIALFAGAGCQKSQPQTVEQASSKSASDDLAQQALEQFLKGDYDEAILLYEKLLRTEPNNKEAIENVALAHANKGLNLKEQGKYEEALLQLSKAEKVADDYPEIRSAIQECRRAMEQGGKPDETQAAAPETAPASSAAAPEEAVAPAKPVIDASNTPQNTARVSYVSGDTVIKGEKDEDWAHATTNSVVESNDTIVTSDDGLSELELSNGAMVRVANASKLDMDTLSSGETKLKLWKGSVNVDTTGVSGSEVRVETPTGEVVISSDSRVRVDVDEDGGTRLTTFAGQAYIDDKSGEPPAPVKQEERTYVEPGHRASTTVRVTREGYDDFDNWSYERTETYVSAAAVVPPSVVLPPIGYRELATSGEWVFLGGAYVWRPVIVETGWIPYRRGYWSWVAPAGWTWVSYDPFGYVTSHYGNWSFASSYGWVWHPGVVYTPAAVTFIEVGDRVAWAPLGLNGRPAVAVGASFHIGDFDFDLSVVSGAMAASFGIGVVEATVIEPAFFTRVAAPRVVNNVNINLNFAPKRVIRGPDTIIRNNINISASATVDKVNRTIKRSSFSVATAVSAQKTSEKDVAAKESKLRVTLAENVKKASAEQTGKARELLQKNREIVRTTSAAAKASEGEAAKLLTGKAEKSSEKKPRLMPKSVATKQPTTVSKKEPSEKKTPATPGLKETPAAQKGKIPTMKMKGHERPRPTETATPAGRAKQEKQKPEEKTSTPPRVEQTPVVQKEKGVKQIKPQATPEKAVSPVVKKTETPAETRKGVAGKDKGATSKTQASPEKVSPAAEKKAAATQKAKVGPAEEKPFAPAEKKPSPVKEERSSKVQKTPTEEKSKIGAASQEPEKKATQTEKRPAITGQRPTSEKQAGAVEERRNAPREKETVPAATKPVTEPTRKDTSQENPKKGAAATERKADDQPRGAAASSRSDRPSKEDKSQQKSSRIVPSGDAQSDSQSTDDDSRKGSSKGKNR